MGTECRGSGSIPAPAGCISSTASPPRCTAFCSLPLRDDDAPQCLLHRFLHHVFVFMPTVVYSRFRALCTRGTPSVQRPTAKQTGCLSASPPRFGSRLARPPCRSIGRPAREFLPHTHTHAHASNCTRRRLLKQSLVLSVSSPHDLGRDGVVICHEPRAERTRFPHVHVFAPDPWHAAAAATVSAFTLQTTP